ADQPEGSSVRVLTAHHVVARRQRLDERVGRGEAGGEAQAVLRALEAGEVALERRARGVVRARVLEAFVLPQRLLGVGARLVDRSHDRAGRGVGLLPRVHRPGADARLGVHVCHYSPPTMNCSMSKRVRIPRTAPSLFTSTAALRDASSRVTTSAGSSAPTTGNGGPMI